MSSCRRGISLHPEGQVPTSRYTGGMFANRPDRPETRILRRIIARRESLGLTQKEVAARIARSDLYGSYTHGSYRNLETTNFEDDSKPRTALNRQLVVALSEALECVVSDLASEDELTAVRPVPYRKAQWPDFMLEEIDRHSRKTKVPQPSLTAKRLDAYIQQHGYTYKFFAEKLTECGYAITAKQLSLAIGRTSNATIRYRHMNYALCEAAVKVFQGPLRRNEFRIEWLIQCRDDGRCPHCYPILISA